VTQDDLKNLEQRVNELITACQQLKKENESLRSEQGDLHDKHAKLLEKTRIARERIETMIGRLKTLERGS
jgi:cell division protein ZapB